MNLRRAWRETEGMDGVMDPAHAYSLGIVAYLALFALIGLIFLSANLLLGRFLRPSLEYEEKQNIYECGEPTIGSSFVQFDLRFYVVALLFIVFDVEIAFFFPWATVFGKSTHLADERLTVVAQDEPGPPTLTPQAAMLYRELGVREPTATEKIPATLVNRIDPNGTRQEKAEAVIRQGARDLSWLLLTDIAVFFAVLLVGFAYVWKRGDLDWVRAIERHRSRGVFEDGISEGGVSEGGGTDPGALRRPSLSA